MMDAVLSLTEREYVQGYLGDLDPCARANVIGVDPVIELSSGGFTSEHSSSGWLTEGSEPPDIDDFVYVNCAPKGEADASFADES